MSSDPRPVVALTPGDCTGIGPEQTARILHDGRLASTARLVVVGNSTFIQNSALTQDQQGLDFVSASLNWLLSREQMIGIAPKIPQTLTFSLDEQSLRKLRWGVLALLPLIPALLGLIVWWRRRA